MAGVSLEFPETVLSALHMSPEEFAREVRFAAAVHWYHSGRVSQENAAEIAGMTRLGFLDLLAERHLDVLLVNIDDLTQELEYDRRCRG